MNSTSKTDLKSTSKNDVRKKVKPTQKCNKLVLISLDTAFSTILITLLQTYLIIHRFKQLAEISSALTSQSFSSLVALPPHTPHLNASIILNTFVLVLASLFTLAYALLNPFKIGVNSHDNFKLGKNLDRTSTATCQNDTFDSDETASSSYSITHRSNTRTKCFWFRHAKFWFRLPPLGATCHMISSLLILMSGLLFVNKRIQLGQTPSGDVFVTKLDFLFGRPIERQPALGDMFSSKDDFSG